MISLKYNFLLQFGTGIKNPLAAIEDEKNNHEDKMMQMAEDMDEVFKRKVEEKESRMKQFQQEEIHRTEIQWKNLKEEKELLIKRKEELAKEIKAWEESVSAEESENVLNSKDVSESKRKKSGISVNPFKFGKI